MPKLYVFNIQGYKKLLVGPCKEILQVIVKLFYVELPPRRGGAVFAKPRLEDEGFVSR